MSKEHTTHVPFVNVIDPVHLQLAMKIQTEKNPLIEDVMIGKYAYENEGAWNDIVGRVCEGIYLNDDDEYAKHIAADAMRNYLWMPAGRILAGAGTAKRVTLMNCFVNGKIEDSMDSILIGHDNTMLTMQQGGGMGTDFSTIRPAGAIVYRTNSVSSGILPFMRGWNTWCETIRSSGDRRGAMMGTLRDTHPDLPAFIIAKQKKGELTNFNVSVLVSDAFMEAVAEDEEWMLHFNVPPANRSEALIDLDFVDDDGVQQYVYSTWKARELHEMITKNTYEYSEPGVIFIDRVNDTNNLYFCEEIACTNPCGEQPLPPHATCNLGHPNLARMVMDPFSDSAAFNWSLLKTIVKIGIRFLDNVIDVTRYPLEEQRLEQMAKRRIGLGFTGLADALVQLRIRYGSIRAQEFADKVAYTIMIASYEESIELAKERGMAPALVGHIEEYLEGNGGQSIASKLPTHMKDEIRKYGIRNLVLNTVAPTGTTSIVYLNPAGGLEPAYMWIMDRKVRQADGETFKTYKNMQYGARLWYYMNQPYVDINKGPLDQLPSYFVSIEDLNIHDHILMQSRIQRWIDASVSKTTNVAKDITYAEFVTVYSLAYQSGCKGCTTYRPSDVRGSILSAVDDGTTSNAGNGTTTLFGEIIDRPDVLHGTTYKVKWPNHGAAFYLTINSMMNGHPYEVFITSKDGTHSEWTTALSLMITAIFRKGGDISFVPQELKQIQSVNGGAWVKGRYVGSLPAQIGNILEQHLQTGDAPTITEVPRKDGKQSYALGEVCPKCQAPTFVREEGCMHCMQCGYSKCG